MENISILPDITKIEVTVQSARYAVVTEIEVTVQNTRY